MKGITDKNGDDITDRLAGDDPKTAMQYLAEIGTLRNLVDQIKEQQTSLRERLDAATREAMRHEQEVIRLRKQYAALDAFVGQTPAQRFAEIERMRAVVEAAVDAVKAIRSSTSLPIHDLDRLYDAVAEYNNTALQPKNKEENHDAVTS